MVSRRFVPSSSPPSPPKPSPRPHVRSIADVCAAPHKQATTETLSKVQTIIAEQLGTEVDKVGADVKFTDLGADSLDTVEIMMALEEQFDITLDEEGAEKIATVQEAADMIEDMVK